MICPRRKTEIESFCRHALHLHCRSSYAQSQPKPPTSDRGVLCGRGFVGLYGVWCLRDHKAIARVGSFAWVWVFCTMQTQAGKFIPELLDENNAHTRSPIPKEGLARPWLGDRDRGFGGGWVVGLSSTGLLWRTSGLCRKVPFLREVPMPRVPDGQGLRWCVDGLLRLALQEPPGGWGESPGAADADGCEQSARRALRKR